MNLYKPGDFKRESSFPDDYRSPFRRDFGRLVHSPSFRRLKCKTQLFPEIESDFFRNRLSHSIEVAQIAKSIAIKLNSKEASLKNNPINLDIVEFAGLAHDLGHPPFGHTGEKILDDCMKKFGGFEGNAQTLRILSKLEKKQKRNNSNTIGFNEATKADERLGLNLTYRTLASILKYDNLIQKERNVKDTLKKGYYYSEKNLIKQIKQNIAGKNFDGPFKTIECSIMDIADDIAYSTYDLEDCFKAKFSSPLDLLSLDEKVIKKIINEKFTPKGLSVSIKTFRLYILQIFAEIFELGFKSLIDSLKKTGLKEAYIDKTVLKYIESNISSYLASKEVCNNGYNRVGLTSSLVNEFINGIEFKYNAQIPALSGVKLKEDTKMSVEILKQYTYEIVINSPMLKIPTYRGKEIVKQIFEIISDNPELLPDDFRDIYNFVKTEDKQKRVICDFISGMTDRYSIEFFGRLFSETPETIFKPIY